MGQLLPALVNGKRFARGDENVTVAVGGGRALDAALSPQFLPAAKRPTGEAPS